MEQWEKDKAVADECFTAARTILAGLFVAPSTLKQDQEEATDLVVFTVMPYTVAWRNRDPAKYLSRYPFDVTLRRSRPSGVRTELTKVINGWGHFLLYSFGAKGRICRWCVLDLDKLRAACICEQRWFRRWYDRPLHNGDGSSTFVALDTRNPVTRACLHSYSDGYFDFGNADGDCPPPDDVQLVEGWD